MGFEEKRLFAEISVHNIGPQFLASPYPFSDRNVLILSSVNRLGEFSPNG
jgi:hypothetical protein